MSMTRAIQAAIRGFEEIILGGIPFLLARNETAFLSFMCSLAGIDALSGYRHETDDVATRFRKFVEEYFPPGYASHAPNLYLLRCRMLHNFSPAYFSLVHGSPQVHLSPSPIGDPILSDESFFEDLRMASEKFFAEVLVDPRRQDVMNARLTNVKRGGSIYSLG
jgi:hypothetical protein